MNIPSKLDVLRMVEEYLIAWEACVVTPEHPLAAVQTLHLAEGGHMGATETRPSGRSRVPIRDLPGGHQRTHNVLKHVAEVDQSYRKALEAYCVYGTHEKSAMALKVDKRKFFDNLQSAIAVFQSGWLLLR